MSGLGDRQRRRGLPPASRTAGPHPPEPAPVARGIAPGNIAALQRTAGNRAVSRMLLQRYVVWNQPDAPELDADAAKEVDVARDAPAYVAAPENLRVRSGHEAATFPSQVAGPNKDFKPQVVKPLSGVSSLKIADSGDLAIENVGQPKAFFATPEQRAKSNEVLLAAHSAYELESDGKTLQVGDQVLEQLMPRNRLTDTKGLQATSLHRCNEMATRVMGMQYNSPPTPDLKEPSADAKTGPHAKILSLVFGSPEFASAYTQLSAPERLELAAMTGINEFADPKVGEAYSIRSLGEIKDGDTWNFHWAGVVAKSSSDAVALENYNRSNDLVNAGDRGEDVDVRWYFQMYGRQLPAQTFHQRTTVTAKLSEPLTATYTKDAETKRAGDATMEGVNPGDHTAVKSRLRGVLGIVDEQSKRETQERAAEGMSAADVLFGDGPLADRLELFLDRFAEVPDDLRKRTIALLTTRDGLSDASRPGDVTAQLKRFCKGFGPMSFKFSQEDWTTWAGPT